MRRFLVLAVTCAAAHAHADRSAADRLAAEAEGLAGKGDLVAAAAKFRAAYAEDPRPELICNVGVAYYKALDFPRAYRYLSQCKDTSAQLEHAFVERVDQVIAAVRQHLSTHDFKPVQVVVEPPTATMKIEGGPYDEPFVGTQLVWLPFGKYALVIHAEGYVDQRIAVDADTREPVTKTARLVRAPQVPAEPARPVEPAREEPHAALTPPEAPVPARSSGRHAALIASVATVGIGAAALGSYLLARSDADAANAAADKHDQSGYNDAKSSAELWQHVSWVGAGLAAGGAIVSTYLWVRAARAPHVEIGGSASGASVSVVGIW